MRTTPIVSRVFLFLTLSFTALAPRSFGQLPAAQQLAELTASDGKVGDQFGTSVAASGGTVVVGAFCAEIGSNRCQGAAYVFVRPASGWSTTSKFVAKLTASDGTAGDSFGQVVAIDRNTIVVAAPFKTINGVAQGEVYVFVKPSTGWKSMTETARLNPSDAATSCVTGIYCSFGGAIAISNQTVVVGSEGNKVGSNQNQGAVYVFVEPSTGWGNMTQTAKLTIASGNAYDDFGLSVAVRGNIVAGGAPGVGNASTPSRGAVYRFYKRSSVWTDSSMPATTLSATDGQQFDYFGWSVALPDDITTLVGAPQFGDPQVGPEFPGKAYIFFLKTEAAELTSSDGVFGDSFGVSVAMNGNTVLVGAPLHPCGSLCNGPGEAYSFIKPGTGWGTTTETDKIVPANAVGGDNFGESVSLTNTGNIALVGARGHTDSGPLQYQGAAYVFVP